MKQLTTTVMRVRDGAGKPFTSIAAIKGESIYDVAKRNGYAQGELDFVEEVLAIRTLFKGEVDSVYETISSINSNVTALDGRITTLENSGSFTVLGSTTFDTSSAETYTVEVDLKDNLLKYGEFIFLIDFSKVNVSKSELSGTNGYYLSPYVVANGAEIDLGRHIVVPSDLDEKRITRPWEYAKIEDPDDTSYAILTGTTEQCISVGSSEIRTVTFK